MSKRLLIAPFLLLTAGCTTLTQGTSQEIAVTTPEIEGARCVVTDAQGNVLARITAPGSARVSRGRQDLAVSCEKAGFRSGVAQLVSSVSPRSRFQVPLGYAVDGISGAMWSYPSEVPVMLAPHSN